MITLKTLSLAEASQVIQAGIARASEISSPSTFCVVDVGDFYGIANGLDGRAIIFPGGVPISVDGEVVGAVGASGGNGEQDEDGGQLIHPGDKQYHHHDHRAGPQQRCRD